MSLEHISTVIPRALAAGAARPSAPSTPNTSREERRLMTLPELVTSFEAVERTENPDVTLKLAELKVDAEERLSAMIAAQLDRAPEKLRQGADVLRKSLGWGVRDIEEEVKSLLHRYRLPQRYVKPIVEAHEREPNANRFGASQAIGLAAQSFAPEERLELEQAAGRYLADFAN